ncbi:MAG: hypothetical protein IAF38_14285 [Bacteroidia bacterium]|nr:hypothetical protein [Bacteroidia bacterium]
MKKLKFIAPLIAAFFLFSCKPSAKEALTYSDAVVHEQAAIQEKENNFITEARDGDTVKMKAALDAFLLQIKTSTAIVSTMEQFDKNGAFKADALKFFEVYKSIAENEYKQILGYYSGEYTEENAAKSTELGDAAATKRQTAFEKFSTIQQAFAKEYKFEIKEN